MKILSADFSKSSNGYNVAICMLSNEGGNKIKSIEVFETESKLEDIAGFIIDKFKLLKCDYVVIDSCGLGVVINDRLKNKLGDKVKEYEPYALEENKIIETLCKNKILEELGLDLKCRISGTGLFVFNRKEYTDFEYLMVKSIGMANKLLNEIEEVNNKVSTGDINIRVECNTDVSIEDLTKEVEKMVSNAHKDMANSWYEGFKDNNIKTTVNVEDISKEIERCVLTNLKDIVSRL